MEIRVLRYFLSIVQEGSITQAAEALHMTQPGLSRQLSDLEKELGASLVVRGKRNITLTDDGQRLYRRAQEIVELIDKTEAEFLAQDENVGGVITIGSAESGTARIISRLLKSFSEKHPQVQYDIVTGTADFIKEQIDKGLIDFALLVEPGGLKRYDFIRLPERERWGVLMPEDAPLAKLPAVTPADLAGLALIHPKRPSLQREISSWFGTAYTKMHIFATYNLPANAILLTAAGLGYMVTIEGIPHTGLTFRPFTPELASFPVLVWKKCHGSSSLIRHFIEEAVMLARHDES